jgi:putative flavoprotein involved in K+ transport
VSGAHGGKTVDFRRLAGRGITLLGMTAGYENGHLKIADDLKANIDAGDENYKSLMQAADDYALANGLDLPLEPEAWDIPDDPWCVKDPIRILSLAEHDITTIIWATGFQFDYSWLRAEGIFDDRGKPIHQRGVSKLPDLYFVGLPWQSRRGSSFIWGVWHDAKFVVDQIAIKQHYLDHHKSFG